MTSGDFSRISFDPTNNVRTVMFWQGRTLTDADLNEGNEAILRRIETEAIDVIGAEGAPLAGGGFRVVKDASQLTPAEAADTRNASDTTLTNLQNAPFLITAGRYYIHGLQIENHRISGPLELTLPVPSAPRFRSQPMPLPVSAIQGTGRKLVYLRAVIDHQTGVEAARLLDPALGDADTSSRAIVAWQVRVMDAPVNMTCGDNLTVWNDMIQASSGRLVVSLNAAAPSTDPCQLTPTGGYVRPENLLYRVQVDSGNVVKTCDDGPRFGRDGLKLKVSRNNAMEVARITNITANNLTVTPASRDGLPTFRTGGWIEILKDGAEARGDPTGWTQINDVSGDVLTVASAAGAVVGDRVRLWSFDKLTVPTNPATPLPLEDGLQITVPANGEFRRGDYWLIPARYAVGPEYWNALTNVSLPPAGPRVEYARLAVIDLAGGLVNAGTVSNCRQTFEPLTELLSFHYAGGDGQTVSPVGVAANAFAPAPSQLRAGVRAGRKAVKGARVRFELLPTPAPTTAGRLSRPAAFGGPGSAQGIGVIVETNAEGVAAVDWSLNLTDAVQRVRAVLLDAGDPTNSTTLPLPIEYAASLNRAAQVAYTPGGCTGLAGIHDVQSALDKVCSDLAKVPGSHPFLVVKQVLGLSPAGNVPIRNNEAITPRAFIDGIRVDFSESIGILPRGFEPILRLTIDMPYPPLQLERSAWAQILSAGIAAPILGTVPLTLVGNLTVLGATLLWTPDQLSSILIDTASKHRFGLSTATPPAPFKPPIIGHLTIRGDCVWSEKRDPLKYLNGEMLAFENAPNPFTMDSGGEFDVQRAADYRIWFPFVF